MFAMRVFLEGFILVLLLHRTNSDPLFIPLCLYFLFMHVYEYVCVYTHECVYNYVCMYMCRPEANAITLDRVFLKRLI